MVETFLEGVTNSTLTYEGNRKDYIYNKTLPMQEFTGEEQMFTVECMNGDARLTFYGQDIFNFRLWILLFTLGILIKVIWR